MFGISGPSRNETAACMQRQAKGIAKVVALALIALIGLPLIANASYIETFDSNGAGWLDVTVNNGGSNLFTASTWNSSGGNAGGYISGAVNNSSDRLYGMQPTIYGEFGNLSGMYLTTDFRITGTVTSGGPLVRFYIGNTSANGSNYWVTADAYSWNPNLDSVWTTHKVPILEENFLKWPNQNANSMTFEQMLSQYNDIGLVFADSAANFNSNNHLGFSSSSGAIIGVDNFGTNPVPIPESVWLLGSGVIGLIAVRRRFGKVTIPPQ